MKKADKNKTSLSQESYSKNEMERYLGALNEMHGENLKAVTDGFSILNRKLDAHAEMIGTIMEDVSELKEDVSVLKSDMSVLKQDVSVLKKDMVTVKDDISTIKKTLQKKADFSDVLSLTRKVQVIESKI